MRLVEIDDLQVTFSQHDGLVQAVRGVSLHLEAGESLGIVGESGSGKSVTCSALLRLLREPPAKIAARAMKLGDTDMLGASRQEISAVRGRVAAMVFQDPMTSLDPVFTIGHQIAETIMTHRKVGRKQALAQALEALRRVEIKNADVVLKYYPHQLSGGMLQRVMIAMALSCEPDVLIADEPTTALDVTIQGQILDLIKELQQETGMAVLFVTHDMGVVAEMADRTLVMYRGDRIESGSTAEIFHAGKQPYTRALLAAVPRLGSMTGRAWPLPFPRVDMTSGAVTELPEIAGTIAADRPPVLSVRNLVTRFPVGSDLIGRPTGAVHAVQDVSFDLFQGETLSIVGESGCGKSTTGRSVMRLIEPNAGSITLNGENVLSLKGSNLRRMRRSIQMIFQDPFSSLNPTMTIGDAVAEPLVKHGIVAGREARGKAADLLEKVGLDRSMLNRYPHEFSGGQRQRVAIARVLGLTPKVIVADESVSALDVSIKAQVCNLLMELQEQFGISYLFISHDMAVVERVSHRVAVMYLGEIVEIGPREAIFSAPRHPYTKKLLAAVPVADPARRSVRRNASGDELRSPIRPLGYVAPQRNYDEVSAGHFVMAS